MYDIAQNRSFLAEIPGLIKLIRPKQWLKNSFVFAPLIFAGEFLKLGSIYSVLFAAFLFCLAALQHARSVQMHKRHRHRS